VLAFFVLIGLHYRLTADRERAVEFFRRLPLGYFRVADATRV
jgi:hypothetical protein